MSSKIENDPRRILDLWRAQRHKRCLPERVSHHFKSMNWVLRRILRASAASLGLSSPFDDTPFTWMIPRSCEGVGVLPSSRSSASAVRLSVPLSLPADDPESDPDIKSACFSQSIRPSTSQYSVRGSRHFGFSPDGLRGNSNSQRRCSG